MTRPAKDRVGPVAVGLCYSCRHSEHHAHCHGAGDMPAEGQFLGLYCSCLCRYEPVPTTHDLTEPRP